MPRHGDVVAATAAYFRTTGHPRVADRILRCADDGGTGTAAARERLRASLPTPAPARVDVRAFFGDILPMICGIYGRMLAALHRCHALVHRYVWDTYDAALGVEKFAQTRTYLFFARTSASLERLLPRKTAPVVSPATASDRTAVSSSDVRALPGDIRTKILRMLPASYRLVAPVCRQFRDDYAVAHFKSHDARENELTLITKRVQMYNTLKLSLATEDALALYFREVRMYGSCHRQRETSLIGAGCGRTDWVERGGVLDARTCYAAAKCGQLRVLRWLKARNCPWDKRTCAAAARHGHRRALIWSRTAGCPWDEDTCWGAASNGHLWVLNWARQNGCPWNEDTCWMAAHRGQLMVLHWLRDERCPWDETKCARGAAAGGHLDVLEWMRVRGCPIDERTGYEAVKSANLKVFMWLQEEGCSFDRTTSKLVAQSGNLEILKWLRKEGYPWDENTCEEAARYRHLGVLKWAIENGCPFREDDLRNIRSPKFFEWFEEHHNKREKEMLE